MIYNDEELILEREEVLLNLIPTYLSPVATPTNHLTKKLQYIDNKE